MTSQSPQWKQRLKYLGSRMLQTKTINQDDMKTDLRRCLSTIQLTFLGIGSTIGVGIYVLLGEIAKVHAGPAVIVCFVLAILITLINALVYAELSSNVPQTGASYTFFYKIFGEYPAFLCGWIMLANYIMSSSVGARAWSGMLDSFFNNSIQTYTTSVLGPVQFGSPFAEHLDFVAFAFQVTVIVIVTCNVQCSSLVNTILGMLTTSVLVFVCIAGLFFGDASNFVNADHGGFLPFSVVGLVKGTSLAIYATNGFDIISMSAEEAKDPAKAIPRAMGLELMFVALVYIGAAVGMLFLIPYWLLDLRSPLSSAFEYSGLTWGKYIVTIGPLFGITNLQMLGLYGCSRVLYRMASDNLFFTLFLKVSPRTGTPTNSVILAGSIISIFALLFDLSYLVAAIVMLMLISNLALGSALIKLKLSESREYIRLADLEPAMIERKKEEDTEFDKPYENQDIAEANGEIQMLSVGSDTAAVVTNSENSENGQVGLELGTLNTVELVTVDHTSIQATLHLEDSSSNASDSHAIGLSRDDRRDDDEDKALCELAVVDPHEDQAEVVLKKEERSMRKSGSIRSRLWTFISPHLPRAFSANVLLLLHWLSSMTLASQLAYGWHDLVTFKPIAIAGLCFLLISLCVLMFLIWLQRTKRVTTSFQTPLMPLVPTLSMVGSAVLLFTTLSTMGVLELVMLTFVGTVLYFSMIWSDMPAQGTMTDDNSEQMRSLVENEGDSEEEM